MQCPICNGDMELYKEELISSKKQGITYKRTRYVCRTDDVWGRLEIPQQMEDKTEVKQDTRDAGKPRATSSGFG